MESVNSPATTNASDGLGSALARQDEAEGPLYYWRPARLPNRQFEAAFVYAIPGVSGVEPAPRNYLSILRAEHTTSSDTSVESLLAGLRQATAAVRGLDRSILGESLLGLAQRAVERLDARQDEDVAAWAKRLAEDVRGAND